MLLIKSNISEAFKQHQDFDMDLQERCMKEIVYYEGCEVLEQDVDAPFLVMFKDRLDQALSNLVWWKVSLLMAGGLELGNL